MGKWIETLKKDIATARDNYVKYYCKKNDIDIDSIEWSSDNYNLFISEIHTTIYDIIYDIDSGQPKGQLIEYCLYIEQRAVLKQSIALNYKSYCMGARLANITTNKTTSGYINKFMLKNGFTVSDVTIVSENVVLINDMYYDINDIIYCIDNNIHRDELYNYNEYSLELYQKDEKANIPIFSEWLNNKK